MQPNDGADRRRKQRCSREDSTIAKEDPDGHSDGHGDRCWSSSFDLLSTKKNTATQFKAIDQ
jgi:hypothetical protein